MFSPEDSKVSTQTDGAGTITETDPANAQPQPANVPTDERTEITQAPQAEPRKPSPIVAIGASAGGLEALEALKQRLRADRMAFVVIQHLPPGHTNMLTDILARGTSLRVVTVEHKMRLEPGTIYVAPPTVEVTVEGTELRVTPDIEGRAPRHNIDAFMRSLAHTAGPMAIGVVLSGSGSDGTLGLKAIKDEGGITFVQEPSTAAQPSMPQSALDAGCADFSLTAAEIGDEMMRLSTHPYVGRARSVRIADSDVSAKIFAQLRAAYGVDFAQYKASTVERRIGRRMALHKLERLNDYLEFLGSDSSELRNLYNDLLIGVTGFFRDHEPFDVLKDVVFPRLLENRGTDTPIRIWVAGCATGEEAYSVAITLLEYLGDRAGSYKIQIFATDIDDDALARARLAVYPANIGLDVTAERLQRFFVRTDKGYQVARQVRDLVVFARQNLGKDPPFSRLDLITCRNVLIYMQPPLQKKVLHIFHYALNPEAYLLLGTSESVGDAAELFSLLDRKIEVYVKRNIPATPVFEYAFAARAQGSDEEPVRGRPDHRPMVSAAQIADRKVIEKYGPPGVIVDDRLDVIQFRGRTGPYLEPAPGVATLNLLKLVRPELIVALRTTTHKALTEGLPATSPPQPLQSEDGARAVSLDVMPLPDAAGRKCLLVVFNEANAQTNPPAQGADQGSGKADVDPRLLQLERELATTKEYLQSTIEELEAANEELQSSNEELQSSNEELQSTNEELETSKEELQSTNEELTTVNDELHNRMNQLSVASDDLRNVLLDSSTSIVIVGDDLRIRRFSSTAEKLLSLTPGDLGRPIAYLRNVVSAGDLDRIASDAISAVVAREQRLRGIDGSWYLMKMVPYLTADQAIRGLVVEFVKTTAPSAGDETQEIPPLAQDVLSTLSQPVMLVDKELRVVWANRSFFEVFAVGPAALGRPVAEAWGGNGEPGELWAFLDEVVSGRPARDVLIDHPFGRAADRPMRFSGRVVPSDGERPLLAVVSMQDV